ncbi:hypothetical protein [Hyella patelloides]|nr:hypothetical protein [Hyella patelloides]
MPSIFSRVFTPLLRNTRIIKEIREAGGAEETKRQERNNEQRTTNN